MLTLSGRSLPTDVPSVSDGRSTRRARRRSSASSRRLAPLRVLMAALSLAVMPPARPRSLLPTMPKARAAPVMRSRARWSACSARRGVRCRPLTGMANRDADDDPEPCELSEWAEPWRDGSLRADAARRRFLAGWSVA